MNKASKRNRVVAQRGDPKLRARTLDHLAVVQRAMEQTVAPDFHDPQIFPAPAPSRAGAARFPLVLQIDASAQQNSFGIIIQPSIDNPVMISSSLVQNPSDEPIVYQSLFERGQAKRLNGKCQGQSILGETLSQPQISIPDENLYVPLLSSSGSTFEWQVRLANDVQPGILGHVSMLAVQDNGNKVLVEGPIPLSVFSGTILRPGLTWASNYRYITFEVIGFSGEVVLDHCLVPVQNGLFSCTPDLVQNVMRTYKPEWDVLLAQSKRYRIVAMDCTLTYTGPLLTNSGVVAVANVDSSIAPSPSQDGTCSYYRALTKRSFDRYNGRLAPAGSSEGGAHWFYAPDDVKHLTMDSLDPYDAFDIPAGVFGVEGMDETGQFTLTVNIVLNYYSEKPEYMMTIQPPIALYNVGLAILRRHVELVSSNDSHLKKLKKAMQGTGKLLGKAGESAFKYVRDHPEQFAESALMLM